MLVLEIFGWVVFGVWVAAVLPSVVWLQFRGIRRRSGREAEPAEWPVVTIVVPARDEGGKIEAALSSLLAIDYPCLEIIAVDDRSTDETGRIMDRLADDERLQVVHVDRLPDGWLGKNHALQLGLSRARGDYVLFTDGDVVFSSDVVRMAMRYVVARGIDHLTVMPGAITGGYVERSLTAFFGLLFAAGLQPWLAPTRFPHVYVGVGAFNLVRRGALESVGGFDVLKMDVLDDVKLGKLLKQTGHRQDVLMGSEAVRVRWQDSAWGVVRGLEKNAFASLNYSLLRTGVVSLAYFAFFLSPFAGLFLLPQPAGFGWAGTVVFMHAAFGVLSWRWGCGASVAPLFLPASLGLAWAFWRSAWVTIRQGGVRWRDTFYPLDELRRNLY